MDSTQACWLLLLMCAATRANFWLRAVRPELTEPFAEHHDTNVWMCLRTILGPGRAPDSAKAISQLPFSSGGLGLTCEVESGSTLSPAPCSAVRNCQGTLEEAGLEIPSWRTLADTSRCGTESGLAASRMFGRATPQTAIVAHSHRPCPRTNEISMRPYGTSAALTALPTNRATRLDTQPFRMWLCRPLSLTPTVHSHLPMRPPS